MCVHTENPSKGRSWKSLFQKDVRDWSRRDFPPVDWSCGIRCVAVTETDRDLQKEFQQLLCDTHEEALAPIMTQEEWNVLPDSEKRLHLALQKIMGMNKRMVSLQVVMAHDNQRMTNIVNWVAIIGFILAVAALFVSGLDAYFGYRQAFP